MRPCPLLEPAVPGATCRYLPREYSPWQTVYGYFRTWRLKDIWTRIHDRLRGLPWRFWIANTSRQQFEAEVERGIDIGKLTFGRKRLVDTFGLLLLVVVYSAGIQDRDGAGRLLTPLAHRFSKLRKIWADGGYAGALIEWVRNLRTRDRIELEIIKRSDSQKGFIVFPRRWVVERTFAWLSFHRRMSKDYEHLPETSEALVRIAIIKLMLARLT